MWEPVQNKLVCQLLQAVEVIQLIQIWCILMNLFPESKRWFVEYTTNEHVGEKTEYFIAQLYSLGWGGRYSKMFCFKLFSWSSPCLLGQDGSCSSAKLPVEPSENMLQNLLLNLPPQTVFTYLGRPRPFILRGSAGTETLLLNTEGTAVSFKYLFMKISNILKQVEKNNIKKVTVGLIKKCAWQRCFIQGIICSCPWVELTFIWMFHQFHQWPSSLGQIPISPSIITDY